MINIQVDDNEFIAIMQALNVASLATSEPIQNRHFYSHLWLKLQADSQKRGQNENPEIQTVETPADSNMSPVGASANGHRPNGARNKRRANNMRR